MGLPTIACKEIASMIDPLDISESRLRRIVWDALGSYSVSELLECARDRDVILRTIAAKQLQLRGTWDVYEAAITFCSSTRDELREIGCYILGQLGTPLMPFKKESASVLIHMMADSVSEVREAAIAAVGHLAIEEAVPYLISAALDPSSSVREMVAFSLGRFQGRGVLETLSQLADDPNREVREWALLSMESIQH